MARQIIVLERQEGSEVSFRALWWFPVTAPARQAYHSKSGAKSAWSGASTQENDDIAAGRVVERAEYVSAPAGTTLAQAQAGLVTMYGIRKAAFDASEDVALSYYGSSYDGATWTMTGL